MQLDISEDPTIRFGDFELESKSGELRKHGRPLKLQPQPSKVLILLASRAGTLVTREEIQQEVWATETFVDFEHGLNFCIKQIRTTLGDNAQSPVFIETIPRRGYRFIAPLKSLESVNGNAEVASAPKPQVAIPEPSAQPELVRTAVATWTIAAVIFTLVAGLIGYVLTNRPGPKPVLPNRKAMLVVLPFDNLSSDPQQDYFSDGLTEETITQLGRLRPQNLAVIARTSSMTYKGANKDIARIGRELGVDYVLEGSVRRDVDKVRITAQLIQVKDQTHLWAETYDVSNKDAIAIQEQVAAKVARSLAIELLPSTNSENAKGSTTVPEAYDSYLKGLYLWNKRTDLDKSIAYFKEATEKDPKYATAYCALANAYVRSFMFGARHEPFDVIAPRARAAAEKAVELNDGLSEAHSALASVEMWLEWNWPEADREFKRAIALNPNYAQVHHDYSWFLVSMGQPDEAINEIKLAQRLDPLSPLTNSDVGWVYLLARRYDEAIDQIKRTLELDPNYGSALACLEKAFELKGMFGEAVEISKKELVGSGVSNEEISALVKSDPKETLTNFKRRELSRMNGMDKMDNPRPFPMASLYLSLGDKDKAFAWLEKALQQRDTHMVSIKVDGSLDSLRNDPRFVELLKRMKLTS